MSRSENINMERCKNKTRGIHYQQKMKHLGDGMESEKFKKT
jgi:hypothetical protein